MCVYVRVCVCVCVCVCVHVEGGEVNMTMHKSKVIYLSWYLPLLSLPSLPVVTSIIDILQFSRPGWS